MSVPQTMTEAERERMDELMRFSVYDKLSANEEAELRALRTKAFAAATARRGPLSALGPVCNA